MIARECYRPVTLRLRLRDNGLAGRLPGGPDCAMAPFPKVLPGSRVDAERAYNARLSGRPGHNSRAVAITKPQRLIAMNKSLAPVACVAIFACAVAHADVTIQDQTTLNLTIIKAHIKSTNSFTDDKKRSESQFSCDGFMSMLCGKNETLEIVRLDQSVTMHGDAKKKTYTETPFLTPEQRQAMEQRMQAEMEKLKSCPTPAPVAASSPTVDTSKCQMTPPTTNVVNTADTASFAGHAAHHSILTMTQSCANKDTGDSCDMAYTFDLWLANDDLPELATRQTFDRNYMHKLGLDQGAPGGTALPPALNQFLSPYKDAMAKLGSESSSLKGYPLKTTFRFAFGGPHCAGSKSGASQGGSSGGSSGGLLTDASGAAAGAAASSTQGAADVSASVAISRSSGGGVGGYIAGSAAGAFANKMIGGLFSKKKSDAAAPPTDSTAGAASTAAPATPGMVTVAELTVETTSIGTGAVPADQFEMPAGWKKLLPPPEKAMAEPACPKIGS